MAFQPKITITRLLLPFFSFGPMGVFLHTHVHKCVIIVEDVVLFSVHMSHLRFSKHKM